MFSVYFFGIGICRSVAATDLSELGEKNTFFFYLWFCTGQQSFNFSVENLLVVINTLILLSDLLIDNEI